MVKEMKKFGSVAALAFLVVSTFAVVQLINRQIDTRRTAAQSSSANFYIESESSSLPPDGSFQIWVDADSQVGYIDFTLEFNRDLVNVVSNFNRTVETMRTIDLTSAAEANETGSLTVKLGLNPLETGSSGAINLGSITFTEVASDENVNTSLSFNLNNSQVVGTNNTEFDLSQDAYNIILNPTEPTPTPIQTGDGQIEFGRVTLNSTIDESVEETINFENNYNNPVVVAYIMTRNGGESVDVRVKDVTSNSAVIFMEEPDDQDHNPETVGYLVAEAGGQTLENGTYIEAGLHQTTSVHRGGENFNGDSILFANSFNDPPVVLHTLNTYNNGAFMSSVSHSVGADGFLVEQEAGETGKNNVEETIGWIAIDSEVSGTINSVEFETGRGSDGTYDGVDDRAHEISHSLSVVPIAIVDGYSGNGIDGYWSRGAGEPTADSIRVFAEEDQRRDSERRHVDEGFSWILIGDTSTPNEPTPTDGPTEPTPTQGPTEPTPTLIPPGTSEGIWLSPEEILQLPTSGSAWQDVLSEANSSWGSACLHDNDCQHDVKTLAGALVAVRLNDSSMRQKTINGIQEAMSSGTSRTLELGRGLQSYVIAADIIGYRTSSFENWLSEILVDTSVSGRCDEGLYQNALCDSTNWGGHERASAIAAALYLNDSAKISELVRVHREYLGLNVSRKTLTYKDTTWHADPNNKAGINRRGSRIEGVYVSGIVPEDWRRGSSDFIWPVPEEDKSGYMWGAMQGHTVASAMLHRAGLVSFTEGDKAILRVMDMLYARDEAGYGEAISNDPVFSYPAEGDDTWIPWVINYYAGTNYPTEAANEGKGMGYTDWTHQ